MFDRARSGQVVYFSMVSALSGNAVAGIASGNISGRRAIDGAAQAVCGGPVIEDAGGQYHLNVFAADIDGNNVGYYFTASGCVPVSIMVVTQQNVSGKLYTASGMNAVVPPATLSGVIANSGIFVTVPIATLSGVIANSGIFATVPIATLSGVVANSGLNVNADVIRWRSVTPNNLLASGRLDAAFDVRTNVARSGTAGTIQLDAGAPTGTSGIFDGHVITIVGGSGAGESRVIQNYGSSGIAFVSPNWTVAAFADSVFTITPSAVGLSGQIRIASGANTVVPVATLSGVVANSGIFATVPVATLSGVIANSGIFVTVPVATLSGVIANSGIFATVPIATLSGVIANSGLNVNANVVRWLGVAPNALLASGRLDAAFDVRTNVARSGTTTTIQLDAGAPTGVSGIYDGHLITIIGGSGAGQTRVIRNYDSSGNVTVSPPWAVAAFADSVFTISPSAVGLSGQVQIASGPFVVATATVGSGVLYLASGSIFRDTFASGVIGGSGGLPQAWGDSGATTVGQNLDKSGYTAGTLSGTTFIASGPFVVAVATVGSGVLYLASGSIFRDTFASGVIGGSGGFPQSWGDSGTVKVGVNIDKSGYTAGTLSGTTFIASGPFVVATATVGSGVLYLASGSIFRDTFASGVLAASGGIATAWGDSGAVKVGVNIDKSGYTAGTLSGTTFIASGPFVSVPVATLSGVVANSGIYATVLPANLSGVVANSGLFVTVPAASISGVQTASGTTYLASGSIFPTTFASGLLTYYVPHKIFTLDFLSMSGDLSIVSGISGRNLANAARKLLNKFDTTATSGYLTIYQEDDARVAMQQALTSQSGAAPITSLDTR